MDHYTDGDDVEGQEDSDDVLDLSLQELATRLEASPLEGETLIGHAKDREDADERDRLERRLGDAALIEDLRSGGFSGLSYDQFEFDLIRYGTSVLHGWMRSGRIFDLLSKRHWNVHPTDVELDELARDVTLRDDIASLVLALTLGPFRENALVGGGWRAEKGANITTYFMGACIVQFANVFRDHRRTSRAWADEVTFHKIDLNENEHGRDVASQVAGDARTLELLESFTPRERRIIALTLNGYEQEEIMEICDEPTVRSVEAVLYRWRKRQQPLILAAKEGTS